MSHNKCNHVHLYGDVQVCTICGTTDMEHLVKSDTITFDKATGFFQAGNLHRPATDITQISVKDTDAGTKKLCMQLKDNVVVEIESGKKKVFSGHGTTGRQIEEFDKAIPELVKAAENHAKLWK